MKILIIEDENQVATFLKRGLEEQSYEVSVALEGNTGLEMILNFQYDVIILDIMLPNMSGLDILSAARTRKITTPIIVLTALGTTENVISGLDKGADDYLVKPFKFEELLARINALTRRSKDYEVEAAYKTNSYSYRDIFLDDDSKLVKRGNDKINLTATEYKLLLYLMKNQDKVLSREQILSSVWGINFELGTNVVDVYINYLRKKIDRPPYKQLIQTVIGMGYVLRNED